MARFSRFTVIFLAALLLVSNSALAQEGGASLNGVVKDASGGVLPGVNVEASSPVLIEKVRTTTTGANGRYDIVGLRPGVYTVTFSLQGFSTVKREGVALNGEFAATIDGELKVGAQEETITVTAEAPVIDITNAKRESSLTNETIEELPTSRIHSSLAQLIPGLETANQDVGATVVAAGLMAGHGTHGADSRIMVNGVSQGSARNSGGGVTTPNMGAFEEATLDYAGVGADSETGGIQVNLIPKEGGNTLKGSTYLNYADQNWQSNNLTNDLIARGLLVRGRIRDNSDFNPGFGGPIQRDKLWFYFSARDLTTNNYVGGLFINQNAGNPNALTYVPVPSQQAVNQHNWKDTQTRFTWQVSPRNKLSVTVEAMRHLEQPSGASATTAVEAASTSKYAQKYQGYLDYAAPLSNKILVEAHMFYREDDWNTGNSDGTQNPLINPITIQSTSFTYAAQKSFNQSHHTGIYYRANMSYVTGSHNIKVGFLNEPAWLRAGTNVVNPLYIQVTKPLDQGGVPNQLTLNAQPNFPQENIKTSLGVYAQDKWTIKRLTFAYGVRYDHFVGGWSAESFGPTPLAPNRNISFPAGTAQNWQDITPRSALTIDLFGNGKTAVKFTANKYPGAASASGLDGTMNPFTALVSTTTRTWTPPNFAYTGGPLVPNCDLTNPLANGDCAKDSNTNFGTNTVAAANTIDPGLSQGWNKRDYNWEFSTGVTQEVLKGLSVDVSYFRRIYGNFTVTDNLAVAATDYTQFSVVAPAGGTFPSAPAGTTLPNGGGYTISGLFDLSPAKFGVPSQNFTTLASNYGKQTEHWNGMDVAIRARLPFGLTLQGGSSTGKTETNTCAIRALLPETAPLNPYCDVNTGFVTEFTGYATYTIPKIGVLTSVTFQNRPSRAVGTTIGGGGGAAASLTYGLQANDPIACGTGTAIAAQLGHACTDSGSNVTIPLITPYSVLPARFSQVDARIGKVLRFGRTRTTINFDVYNLLNSNSILTSNTSYAVWQQPTSLLLARFAKIGLQFDF